MGDGTFCGDMLSSDAEGVGYSGCSRLPNGGSISLTRGRVQQVSAEPASARSLGAPGPREAAAAPSTELHCLTCHIENR